MRALIEFVLYGKCMLKICCGSLNTNLPHIDSDSISSLGNSYIIAPSMHYQLNRQVSFSHNNLFNVFLLKCNK